MLSRMFTLLFYIQRKQIKDEKEPYFTIQKFGVSKIFFNSAIKLIKSNSKDIYNVTKDFYFK